MGLEAPPRVELKAPPKGAASGPFLPKKYVTQNFLLFQLP